MQCMNNLMEFRPSLKSPLTENCGCYFCLLSVHPYLSSSAAQSVFWTNWCGDTGGTTDTVGSIIDLAGLNLGTHKCRLKPILFLNKTIIWTLSQSASSNEQDVRGHLKCDLLPLPFRNSLLTINPLMNFGSGFFPLLCRTVESFGREGLYACVIPQWDNVPLVFLGRKKGILLGEKNVSYLGLKIVLLSLHSPFCQLNPLLIPLTPEKSWLLWSFDCKG